MDYVWVVLGGLFILLGLAGCFIPILPGPPLALAGLWIQQLKNISPFSNRTILIFLLLTLLITAIDYLLPVYSTRKFGGSKFGVWGCMIGLIVGLWLGPIGIIAGPLFGAFLGELMANQNSTQAVRAATGSFIGFLAGTIMKLVICVVMLGFWISSII